ncbi:hypothetical protein CLU79DRAFT_692324, partial [Phycomyces nitens]
SFKTEHNIFIQSLLDENPQLYTRDIVGGLSRQFMRFSISKTQLNYHSMKNMLVTIKRPTFEPKVRNSACNLHAIYE